MKKLLNLFALALAVTVGFTSCDDQTYDDDPYAAGYKPGATTLNTDHALVGKLYSEAGEETDWTKAMGIVFAVSQDGTTAYLCAYTDVMQGIGVFEADWQSANLEWGKLAKGTEMKELGCKNADGSVNTDLIVNDTTITSTAAAACREYYPRPFTPQDLPAVPNTDRIDLKGKYYLPSAEELEALVKNAEKINNLYLNNNPASATVVDGTNGVRFSALGGDFGNAYWSSTEFNNKCAWYRIVNKNEDGEQIADYLDKTIATGGGKGLMRVRPICKVAIK